MFGDGVAVDRSDTKSVYIKKQIRFLNLFIYVPLLRFQLSAPPLFILKIKPNAQTRIQKTQLSPGKTIMLYVIKAVYHDSSHCSSVTKS